MNYEDFVHQCRVDLQQGLGTQVQELLAQLDVNEVPRPWRQPVAELCRRSGAVPVGLRLLTPIVRPKDRRARTRPSAQESAEYAALLNISGAWQEALAVLRDLDGQEAPQIFLFQAFCRFSQWDYEKAIPFLESYLASDLEPYARLVGQVNLASAFVNLNQEAAGDALLKELIATCRQSSYARLLANCLEMGARLEIRRQNYVLAKDHLESAHEILKTDSTSDQFFVEKWKSILSALSSGAVEPIDALRTSAIQQRDWETVRETDFYRLKIAREPERLNHLLFGTPFPSYRQRIFKEFAYVPTEKIYKYGSMDGPALSVATGEISHDKVISIAQTTLQLIDVLTRDLYRPMSLGAIFTDLFPGEAFDIFTTPNRLHQIIFRARNWIIEQNLAMEIEELAGAFWIRISGPLSLLLPLERQYIDWDQAKLLKLKQVFQRKFFTTKDAREQLSMTPSTFQRFAARAMEQGLLIREGAGPGVLYRLAK